MKQGCNHVQPNDVNCMLFKRLSKTSIYQIIKSQQQKTIDRNNSLLSLSSLTTSWFPLPRRHHVISFCYLGKKVECLEGKALYTQRVTRNFAKVHLLSNLNVLRWNKESSKRAKPMWKRQLNWRNAVPKSVDCSGYIIGRPSSSLSAGTRQSDGRFSHLDGFTQHGHHFEEEGKLLSGWIQNTNQIRVPNSRRNALCLALNHFPISSLATLAKPAQSWTRVKLKQPAPNG